MVSPILRVADRLDAGEDEPDLADAELVDHASAWARTRRPVRLRTPDRVAISRIFIPGRITPSMTRVRMIDAAVGVVPGVEDQRLERRVRLALRRRQAMDDRLEDLVDAGALLRARQNRARWHRGR